jgi:hypothetical protein
LLLVHDPHALRDRLYLDNHDPDRDQVLVEGSTTNAFKAASVGVAEGTDAVRETADGSLYCANEVGKPLGYEHVCKTGRGCAP